MTSVGAESVRELASALGVEYEREVEDTGLPGGEMFVDGELVVTTEPCFVAIVNGCSFRDPTAALLYCREAAG
jgi:hypothetical protein